MDIKCRKTNCTHNKGLTCQAKSITIGGDAECKAYEKDDNAHDFSKNMFEADTEHYENSRHIKDIKLTCNKESCLFNKDNNCTANGITVLDEKNATQCGTYLKDVPTN